MKKIERHVAALEALMVSAAAGLSAAVWMSVAGVGISHSEPQPVTIAAATVQNTAANPVTLAQ
jgi:hypothetical protein